MSNDGDNKLFKQDIDVKGEIHKRSFFSDNIVILSKICHSLSKPTNKYEPFFTMLAINEYIKQENEGRLFYSEISRYVFSLNIKERGAFISNLENLVAYSHSEPSTEYNRKACERIVTKIYDHTMLVNQQMEMADQIFHEKIAKTTNDLKEDNKKIQKEYITILGIFAAISLTFIGELTFSASVLQNMHLVSIYRLVLVIDLLALIFSNMVYFLINFIAAINSKEKSNFNFASKIIKCINISCLVVGVITIFLRVFDFTGFVNYISGLLPWG